MKLIITDDHRLVRESVKAMLAQVGDVHVAGEAESGEQALELCRRDAPDVVLMDIMMPGMGGLEATRRLLRMCPHTAVLALSAHAEAPYPAQMLKAGALGYLTKDVGAAELERALRRVYCGKRYVCHEIAQELACGAFEDGHENPFDSLSHREMQIMMMVVGCHKVRDISGSLHLSPKTVNSYRYRIFDKLKVSSDVELALLAVQYGIVATAARPPRANVARVG